MEEKLESFENRAEAGNADESRDIVVSRKKLDEYIKGSCKSKVKKSFKSIIDPKNKDNAKAMIINFVSENVGLLKSKKYVKELVVTLSLISFYFRGSGNGNRNATKVKFGENNQGLLNKVKGWINGEGEDKISDKEESTNAIIAIFGRPKQISPSEWLQIDWLIDRISADEAELDERKKRKEEKMAIKKANENIEKRANEILADATLQTLSQLKLAFNDFATNTINDIGPLIAPLQYMNSALISGEAFNWPKFYTDENFGGIVGQAREALEKIWKKAIELYTTGAKDYLDKKKIAQIRVVGNIWSGVKYVVFKDGKELILYPSFAGSQASLGYIVNHLCKIADPSLTKSSYPGGTEIFPKDQTYTVSEYTTGGLNAIQNAYENNWVQTWKDFLEEEVGFVHTLDANGNVSNDWLKYGQIIEMKEDDWRELLKKLDEKEEEEREKRRIANTDLDINDTKRLEKLSRHAPPETIAPENILKTHKYTGVYLWAKGYKVKKFLGAGGFGAAWTCESTDDPSGYIVMKVLSGNEYSTNAGNESATLEEIKSVETLNDILAADTTGRAKRYLLKMDVAKSTDKGVGSLIKSALAEGDLLHITWNKYNEDLKNGRRKPLKLSGVLRRGRQALKSVQALHIAGYSHNDIKPENFLRTQNWAGKKEKQDAVNNIIDIINSAESPENKVNKIKNINITTKSLKKIEEIMDSGVDPAQKINKISEFIKDKKLHKHSLQLSDFGTLTKIELENSPGMGVWCGIGSNGYVCREDIRNVHPDSDGKMYVESARIAKRDVYALGVTLMHFLVARIGWDVVNAVGWLQKNAVTASAATEIIERYGENSSDTIVKYLKLIQKMVNVNWEDRITLDDALAELQSL